MRMGFRELAVTTRRILGEPTERVNVDDGARLP
jgi:hypothetical protein